MTEQETSLEVKQGYENEVVAGFAELADLAADVYERDVSEMTEMYETTGSSEGVFTGVTLVDVEGLMANRYPDVEAEDIGVKAAQLFNRIAMEAHGMPEPDDLSRLDTSSYSAKMKTSDVLAYAVAHAQDHMTHPDGKFQKEKIGKYASFSGGDEAFQKTVQDEILNRTQQFGFRLNSSKYPHVPEYI